MAVCLLIVHLPKMHKHVHELLGILLPIGIVCFSCIKRWFAHVSVVF